MVSIIDVTVDFSGATVVVVFGIPVDVIFLGVDLVK